MNLREVTDIFPAYYAEIPDEYDLRRMCYAHREKCQYPEDLTRWIDRKECPYMREALATEMLHLIHEDEECAIAPAIREEIGDKLKYIIRHAQTDQLADEMLYGEQIIVPTPKSVSAPNYTHRLEDQMAYMQSEIDELKRKVADTPRKEFLWPYYAGNVSEGDKQSFEDFLQTLCTGSMNTGDIKTYLGVKEKDGIIHRPRLSTEYDILRLFGYRRAKSTYLNA